MSMQPTPPDRRPRAVSYDARGGSVKNARTQSLSPASYQRDQRVSRQSHSPLQPLPEVGSPRKFSSSPRGPHATPSPRKQQRAQSIGPGALPLGGIKGSPRGNGLSQSYAQPRGALTDRQAHRKVDMLLAQVEEYRVVIQQLSQKNRNLETRLAEMHEREEELLASHQDEVTQLRARITELELTADDDQAMSIHAGASSASSSVARIEPTTEPISASASTSDTPSVSGGQSTLAVPEKTTRSRKESVSSLGVQLKILGKMKRMRDVVRKNISQLDLNDRRRSERIALCRTAFPAFDEPQIAAAVHKLEQDLKWQESHGSLFDDLCLARFDPAVDVADFDTRVMAEFGRDAVCFICTMGDIGELLLRRGVYFVSGLIVKMRRIMLGVLKLFPDGILIKTDDKKSFITFEDVNHALLAAHLMNQRLADYNVKEASDDPDSVIQLQYGIDYGALLFIPHDYYGDAVNCASKLGEDSADKGETFLSIPAYDKLMKEMRDDISLKPLFDAFEFEDGQVEQSKVLLDYKNVCPKDDATAELTAYVKKQLAYPVKIPRMSEFSRVISLVSNPDEDFDDIVTKVRERWERERVIFVSDMSGFTRIVKAHGILHFLAMIYKMRAIVNPILEKHGGTVIKFEADNVFALFDDPAGAVAASLEAQEALYKYNRFDTDDPVDRDNAIKISVGIANGPIVYVPEDEDVFGPTVDLCFDLGEDVAESGEVLISQEMRAVLDEDAELRKGYDYEERDLEKGSVIIPVFNVTKTKS